MGYSHEAISGFIGCVGILQRAVCSVGKEVERLEVLSQEENRRITEWLSGREEITTRAELEELLSKDIVWINREKKELTALKERFTTVQAVLAERCQLLAKHGEGSHKPSEGETEESLLFKLSACQSSKEQQTTRLTQIGLMLDGQEKTGRHWQAFGKSWTKSN